ncbi:MAG: NYN domain-containing protein [Ignavibacteria bacterium]|nr:NYN domain-containing protein [Ignavibacteria bacterium]
MRVKIFIDFWNLQLSWNEYHQNLGSSATVKIPWNKTLPQVLLSRVGSDAVYAGTHVYASVNPKSAADRKLNAFLQIMDTFPGYRVTVKQRRPAKPVRCTNEGCRQEIRTCPHCRNDLTRTVEKGVDTTIAIELFELAFDDVYDRAILISGDADFVPAIEYIQRRGKYIIHAGFKGQSYDIRKASWDHIYFDDAMADLLTASES